MKSQGLSVDQSGKSTDITRKKQRKAAELILNRENNGLYLGTQKTLLHTVLHLPTAFYACTKSTIEISGGVFFPAAQTIIAANEQYLAA